ncbi:hypothetical protein F2P81_009196 [Scophthalmus maximus]|uniref:Uncharacterized protein n=1 Tax=Scophthalmus maximus TaxID=52904 RepID=A0A6A4T978_SCOMX|nr:hypothetical protein F2P81_009196 [Scophthalmus maximus]
MYREPSRPMRSDTDVKCKTIAFIEQGQYGLDMTSFLCTLADECRMNLLRDGGVLQRLAAAERHITACRSQAARQQDRQALHGPEAVLSAQQHFPLTFI